LRFDSNNRGHRSEGMIVEVGHPMSKFPDKCAVYDITGLADMVIMANSEVVEVNNFVKSDLALP
ncbi:MAG: hypothetical protein ACRD8Z_12490, partial [Nitrososphaeraceae archaeon]